MTGTTGIDKPYSMFREKLAVAAPDARIDQWNGTIHLTSWHGAALDNELVLHLDRGHVAGVVWAREATAGPMWPHTSPSQAAVNLLMEQIGTAIARRDRDARHLHVTLNGVSASRSAAAA